MEDEHIPERAKIPWRGGLAIFLIGILWMVFWLPNLMKNRNSQSGKPVITPGLKLPNEIETLCNSVDKGDFIAASRLMRQIPLLDDEIRILVARRAFLGWQNDGPQTTYTKVLPGLRKELFSQLKISMTDQECANESIALYGELFINRCDRAWISGITFEEKEALFKLLNYGLNKPQDEFSATVRINALGFVSIVEDPASLPYLKTMAKDVLNANTAANVKTLISKL